MHSRDTLSNPSAKMDGLENQYLRLLWQAAREGAAIHDQGSIIFSNDALAEMFGYNPDDFVGMKISDLISPATHDILEKKLKIGRNGLFETYGLRKNGTTFLAEVYVIHSDAKGVLLFRDVTKINNVEKALLRTEQEYKSLFEDSKDGIYISSREGRILDANKALLDLFGYSKEEILMLDIHQLYVNPRDRYRFQLEVEAIGGVRDYEVRLRRKDGTIMTCLLSSTVRKAKDTDVIGYQGIIRDITELKKAQELKKEKELAEHSAKLKEQFLANMSHEIRTPMNAVFGMTNLLLDTDLDPQQRKYLEIIQSSTDHLLVLINDILDFSKIEAGKIEFSAIEFSVQDLFENLISTLKYKIENKRLELNSKIDAKIPDYIIGDSVRLSQILINLLSNAIKFTPRGEIVLKAKLIEESSGSATIAFSVSDTGIGIPEDRLEQIFDSFTQGSEVTTREYGGTGLGLAITKELVELQGGSISVKSKIDEGTTFNVILKFKKGSLNKKQHEFNTSDRLIFQDLGTLRILLAEDNKVNQFVIQETIQKWGAKISIDIADNGDIAINKFSQRNYDLIIMDVQMPVMNGYEATRYIRKNFASPKNQVPILALTAFATVGEADKCLSVGMNDYVSKPFDHKTLYDKIAQLTNREGSIKKLEEEPNDLSRTSVGIPNPSLSDTVNLIDLTYLNTITQQDEILREQMIKLMLSETPDELNKMQQLFKQEDWERLAAMAHKFKSTGTYLGNKEIEQDIKLLENLLKNFHSKEEVEKLLTKIDKMCRAACNELEKVLDY